MSLREKKSPLNFFTQLGIQLVWFPDCKCVSFANLFAPVLFGGSAFERQAALKDHRAEPIWFRCGHQQLAPPALCPPAAADAAGTQGICPSQGSLRLRGCGGPTCRPPTVWQLQNPHVKAAVKSFATRRIPSRPATGLMLRGIVWPRLFHASLGSQHHPKLLGSLQKPYRVFRFSVQLPENS